MGQTGELTFKDFITMSKTFAKMGNDMPGVVGELSESQLTELRDKFERHQSIVEIGDEIILAGCTWAAPRHRSLPAGTPLRVDTSLLGQVFEALGNRAEHFPSERVLELHLDGRRDGD